MARKTIFVSDFSGKEIDEKSAQTVRIQGPEGEWYSLDGSDKEIQDALGKFMNDDFNATTEVMQEQEQKFSRLLKAKVESGELLEASSVRGQTRKTRVDSGSGKSSEELSAIRQWAKDNGIEVSDRGRIAQTVIKQYEDAKGAKQDA